MIDVALFSEKSLSLSKIVSNLNVNYNFRSCTHCFILIRGVLSRKMLSEM